MSIEAIPCHFCGLVQPSPVDVAARVERMLDTAENVDLWQLEQCRRRVERDLAELAVLAGTSEDLVANALHELCEKDLLDVEPQLMQSTISGESRREAIGRVARYGAVAATGSMIVSATAATPAMASSGEEKGSGGTEGGQTCIVKSGSTCCMCKNDCVGTFKNGEKAECEKFCTTAPRNGFTAFEEGKACS